MALKAPLLAIDPSQKRRNLTVGDLADYLKEIPADTPLMVDANDALHPVIYVALMLAQQDAGSDLFTQATYGTVVLTFGGR